MFFQSEKFQELQLDIIGHSISFIDNITDVIEQDLEHNKDFVNYVNFYIEECLRVLSVMTLDRVEEIQLYSNNLQNLSDYMNDLAVGNGLVYTNLVEKIDENTLFLADNFNGYAKTLEIAMTSLTEYDNLNGETDVEDYVELYWSDKFLDLMMEQTEVVHEQMLIGFLMNIYSFITYNENWFYNSTIRFEVQSIYPRYEDETQYAHDSNVTVYSYFLQKIALLRDTLKHIPKSLEIYNRLFYDNDTNWLTKDKYSADLIVNELSYVLMKVDNSILQYSMDNVFLYSRLYS